MNVVIYWATGSLPRTYKLLQMAKLKDIPTIEPKVGYTAYPEAVASIPRELSQASQLQSFIRSIRMSTGGPFPTFENPTQHVTELREFFQIASRAIPK